MKSLFFAVVFAFIVSAQAADLNKLACTSKKSNAEEIALIKKAGKYSLAKRTAVVSNSTPKYELKDVSGLVLNECFRDDQGSPLVSCRGTYNGNVVKLKSTVQIEESIEVERTEGSDVATGVIVRKAEEKEIQLEVKQLAATAANGEKEWKKIETLSFDYKYKDVTCSIE